MKRGHSLLLRDHARLPDAELALLRSDLTPLTMLQEREGERILGHAACRVAHATGTRGREGSLE